MPMLHGCTTRIATRTFWCNPGCEASSTPCSSSTRGGITTLTSIGATPRANSLRMTTMVPWRARCGAIVAAILTVIVPPTPAVAADYVYSWKRLLDPRVRSPFAWYLQGKIVGAERVLEAAKESGRFDYDAPIEGLVALDRYTLRLKLKDPDYIMAGYMTQSPMAAVAREVIEAYADASGWAMANPVGTGPYMLKSWRRGAQIVLEANPNYRDEVFPDSNDPADKELVARMRGKKLPIVGRIEISIIEESNPRLLGFNSGALDYVNVPSDLSDHVLDASGRLKPEYVDRGTVLA